MQGFFLQLSENGELSIRSLRPGSDSAMCVWSTLTCNPVVRQVNIARIMVQDILNQAAFRKLKEDMLLWNKKIIEYGGPIARIVWKHTLTYARACQVGLLKWARILHKTMVEQWQLLAAALRDKSGLECTSGNAAIHAVNSLKKNIIHWWSKLVSYPTLTAEDKNNNHTGARGGSSSGSSSNSGRSSGSGGSSNSSGRSSGSGSSGSGGSSSGNSGSSNSNSSGRSSGSSSGSSSNSKRNSSSSSRNRSGESNTGNRKVKDEKKHEDTRAQPDHTSSRTKEKKQGNEDDGKEKTYNYYDDIPREKRRRKRRSQ